MQAISSFLKNRVEQRKGSPLPLPPFSLRFMNESDDRFISFGDEAVGYLRDLCGLERTSNVLDVGCGYGRLAHALYRAPDFQGRYLGLDILKPHIAWCQQEIQRRARRRFAFKVLDVQNDRYNPRGTIDPTKVQFPVGDRWADCVALFSVFTHMFPDQVVHYLDEIKRVLRPEGCALITFLLLDAASNESLREGKTAYRLPHQPHPFMRTMSLDDPLHAVAYEQTWVAERVRESGLRLVAIRSGSWSGRKDGISFQDIVLVGHAQ